MLDVDGKSEVQLPGYLYLPSAQHGLPDGKIPVLLNAGGADSVQEELYYIHPQGGHTRGYAVLTFEGPGQGIVLREHGLHMRSDWEVVTGQVLDWLEEYSVTLKREVGVELDLDRIAVAGASMGGYYALRAAKDVRIKACVAIDPFYDMWDFGTKHISGMFMSAWTGGWIGDDWVEEHTMRVFDDLGHLEEKCRGVWMPNRPEVGGLQAKIGAFGLVNLKAYAFLDEVFGIWRVTVES